MIKFITADNEVQKLYAKLGLAVPVGDLATGKAPAVKPISASSTQTSVTAVFNVMTGEDMTSLSYTVNDGEPQSITPAKGVVTITVTDLEYNSGPYTIELTAENETGSTSSHITVDLQKYTDWAEPESVLAGNKFIAEGEEMVGTIQTKTDSDIVVSGGGEFITIPAGYFADTVTVRSYPEPSYFCVETLYDEENARYQNTIDFIGKGTNSSNIGKFYYSFDKTNWTPYVSGTPITVSGEGSKVYIYGDNLLGISSSSSNYTCISIQGAANVSGDIRTLASKNPALFTTMPNYCFEHLFSDENTVSSLKSAENLVLTEFTSDYCYEKMFYGCTSLTAAPTLPATTIARYGYRGMFQGCTSLTAAPALPATTLSSDCYESMFEGCTSLTSAPALPATVLAMDCYFKMFKDCTSLTSAPALPATTLNQYCYEEMFNGCTSLTEAPELPATTLAKSCYIKMFQGCTSLTEAPELPATTLASNCYQQMFYGCTALTEAPELPATTLDTACYSSMFQGCTALTEAPELPATTLAGSCYNGMFQDCTALTEAPELPATTINSACYYSMFQGCTSLTEAPELPATTLYTNCYKSMFQGCTSLTSVPELPATTLAQSCYESMFSGCTSLTAADITGEITNMSATTCMATMFDGCSNLSEVTVHATTWTANRANNWLRDVSATGDFYNLGGATIPTGTNGIPSGWTEHTTI